MSRSTSVTTNRRHNPKIRAMGVAAGFAAATVASACLNFDPFGCQDDTQCDAQDMGVCQLSVGYCSYPDLACIDTGYRYEENAGDGLGGECVVPMAAPTSTSTSSTDPTDADSGTLDDSGTTSIDPTTSTDDGTSTGGECGGGGQECCDGAMCNAGLSCSEGLCGCVESVQVGDRHSCAIKLDGSVWCWGANDLGQLAADPLVTPNSPTPVQINGFGPGAEAASLHTRTHTCVRLANNSLRCWGDNTGIKVNPSAIPPVVMLPEQVSLGDAVTVVDAGGTHSCAGLNNATAVCWGDNASGQLSGMGMPGPVSVGSIGGMAPDAMALGQSHSCATNVMGAIFCWGNNAFGQLGVDPAMFPTSAVVQAVPVPPVGQVVAGNDHMCALTGTDVVCWGRNSQGQLGIDSQVDTFTPSMVVFPPGSAVVSTLAAGADQTCAVLATGDVFCWGGNQNGELLLPPDMNGEDGFALTPRAIDLGFTVAQLATGATHSCALSTNGQVWCWGDNSQGQIGDGTMTDALQPTPAQLACP